MLNFRKYNFKVFDTLRVSSFLRTKVMKMSLIFAGSAVLIAAGTFFPRAAIASDFTLKSVHQDIISDHKNLSHINRKALAALLEAKDQNQLLLLDVREQDEFAVSHISGARRLAPNSWRSSFMKNYAGQLTGKTVVFYCSVGVRSSIMASALKEDLIKAGVKNVYNLEEGIFGWANHGLNMRNQNGETKLVHPYNEKWGQLISHKNIRSYQPE